MRVTTPPQAQRHWLLVVQPGYLDSIQVFTRATTEAGEGRWLVREQGDRLPFAQRERSDLKYSFSIDLSSSHSTVVYVRLETTSTHALLVRVQSASQVENDEKNLYLGMGVYSGLVLMLGVFSGFRFVITGKRLWGINALSQMVAVGMVVMYLGFWSKYIAPDDPKSGDIGTSVLVCLHLFVVLWYYREFAIDFRAPRWLVWVLSLCLLALPFQLWAIANDHARWAVQLNSMLILLRTLGGFVVAWLFVIDDRLLRWMVRFAHLSMSTYGVVFILPLLGYGEMDEWHLYPPMLINLFSAVMQYLVLNRRDWLAHREQIHLRQRIQQTEQELRGEQLRLAQSTSFMSMLLHELKNPLASIRLSTLNLMQGRSNSVPEQQLRLQRIHQSIDGIDAVLERCRQVDQLEQGAWDQLQKQTHDAVALLNEWLRANSDAQRLHTHTPPQVSLQTDAGLFKTMVGNLIDNALAYSPPASVVAVTMEEHTQAQTRWLTLTVRNDIGKAGAPDPQKVFTKYYRAAAAHQRTGSGLGLFLVKNLAELAHGSLHYRVEHPAQHGASEQVVFELRLPCTS
jgi:signal transduction histidine kinase